MRSTTVLRMALTIALVALATPVAAQVAEGRLPRATAQTSATAQARSQLRGFSVVLVEGSTSGTTATEGVPGAAAKALADLKDFLPYKSYRLLDTQWTLGAGRIASRLRGVGAQEYDLVLNARGSGATFVENVPRSGGEAVAARGFRFTTLGQVTISQFSLREVDPLRATPAALKQEIDVAGSLINTSFSMDVGETVVVGTSRLQGDKALIVLLTAVAK